MHSILFENPDKEAIDFCLVKSIAPTIIMLGQSYPIHIPYPHKQSADFVLKFGIFLVAQNCNFWTVIIQKLQHFQTIFFK